MPTISVLPTKEDLLTMDFSYLGYPFVHVTAKLSYKIPDAEYSYFGYPFWVTEDLIKAPILPTTYFIAYINTFMMYENVEINSSGKNYTSKLAQDIDTDVEIDLLGKTYISKLAQNDYYEVKI